MEEQENLIMPMPAYIQKAIKRINIIFTILISFRAVPILIFFILNSLGYDCSSSISGYARDIVLLTLYYLAIRCGHRKIMILPVLGSIKFLSEITNVIILNNGSIFSVFIAFLLLLMLSFQFISMLYLLTSSKIGTYCEYIKKNS